MDFKHQLIQFTMLLSLCTLPSQLLWSKAAPLNESSTAKELSQIIAESASDSRDIGGGSDTGGNLYRRQPLESWAKKLESDPETIDAYNMLILPFLDHLKQKAQRGDGQNRYASEFATLVNFLNYIYHGKKWFFVPGPLPAISSELVGSAVETDQGALQLIDKIFIDLDHWKMMTNEARATLLLHEGLMGLKVLQYASSATQCAASLYKKGSCSGILSTEKDKISLSAADYTDVQDMTIDLKNFHLVEDEVLMDFLIHKFRFVFPWFEMKNTMMSSKLFQFLEVATISNNLPTIGYSSTAAESFTCKLKFDAAKNGKSLTIQFKLKNKNYSIPFEIPKEVQIFTRRYAKQQLITVFGFSQNTGKPGPQGGYIQNSVGFYKLGEKFNFIFGQNICTDKKCSNDAIITPLNGGIKFFCSHPELNDIF